MAGVRAGAAPVAVMTLTTQQRRERRDLVLGSMLSMSLCLACGLASDRVVVYHGPADAAELAIAVLTEEELEPEVRLGIERSEAVTENWLGFETPTEHSAPESAVEQSAMALEEGRDEEAERQTDEGTETRTDEGMAASGRALLGVAEAWAEALRAAMAQRSEALAAAEDGSHGLPAIEVVEEIGAVEAGQAVAPGQAVAHESESADDSAPGVLSDKESVAAARKSAPVVLPGRVVSAHGLEISTRRPQWARTTLSTTRPRNPVVWITFGRDGRVRRAGFVRDSERVYDTGYASVDEPLMNAVYRWTAKGKALDDLPRDRPEAGITIRVTVLLVG